MKKLTKKAIKEAANYMVMIDWKTNYRSALDTEVLEAKTLIEAMDEATEYGNENTYLLAILEKGEAVEIDEETGVEYIPYREVLRSRSEGNWRTIKQEGYTEGALWGRFFLGAGAEHTTILRCSK